MATARTIFYECKNLQTYNGLKELILNCNDMDDTDTFDLTTLTSYKNTKVIVDAATATDYDEELDVSDITAANIRFAYGVMPVDGAFVPLVVSTSGTDVTFTLTSKFDILSVNLPARKYSRNYCGWKTLGCTECGYGGAETECNKTLTRCRVLANSGRFGGFPSIPSRKLWTS